MEPNSRRKFIKNTALSAGLLPFVNFPLSASTFNDTPNTLSVHLFSKHLQFLEYKDAGQVTAEMGFAGLDLTVRPKGHVKPESVKEDLPFALSEIKKGGSSCKMITTSIKSVTNPLDVTILNTAADLGIDYYRTNWFSYKKNKTLEESLDFYKEEVRNLGLLNEKLGIVGCYQNHAGTNIGASFWEVHKLLENVNPKYFGTQYDIRHAMVEGGFSWQNGLRLLQSKIKVIVLKDYKWIITNDKWKLINVPIGEGMVDFDSYFKLLKKYELRPPVSLHLEYDLGGAEKGNKEITVTKDVIFNAMKKDLNMVQQIWKNA